MLEIPSILDKLRLKSAERFDGYMENQDRCISYFIMDDGEMFGKVGACFSYLYDVEDRERCPYIGFYTKEPIIPVEVRDSWVSFVMEYYTELAGKKLFETGVQDLPWVIINTDHQYNLITSCLISLRMVYEQHFYILLWDSLVKAGVDKVTAWIFTHLCNATPDDEDHFWLYMKPHRPFKFYVPHGNMIFHTSLDDDEFSHATLKRMYKREYVKGTTSHWRDSNGGVKSMHKLFGSGNDGEVVGFVKKLSSKSLQKSNNPFTRGETKDTSKLSLEDTVKFFLSVVEEFEKEYKP